MTGCEMSLPLLALLDVAAMLEPWLQLGTRGGRIFCLQDTDLLISLSAPHNVQMDSGSATDDQHDQSP